MKLGKMELVSAESIWSEEELENAAYALGCSRDELITCGAYIYRHDEFVCPVATGLVRAFDATYNKTVMREAS